MPECTIDTLNHEPRDDFPGGTQAIVFFGNGFGASVIKNPTSYGGDKDLWEIAVLKGDKDDWEITYDTPITDDVLGSLTDDNAADVLHQIAALSA